MNFSESRLISLETLQEINSMTLGPRENQVLIYDQVLESAMPEFEPFAKTFPMRHGVQAGENLKALESFPSHVEAILAGVQDTHILSGVIAVGGGSVCDFAGFFASVWKRGVPWVLVPSTWLCALDSAHGGKTALNVGGVKNQIGTFYPAEQVILVRSLLRSQPPERAWEALGECFKIAWIDGSEWSERLRIAVVNGYEDGEALLEEHLLSAIESKLKVVRQDWRDTQGIRRILNLGHTLGHILESVHGCPHGMSVTYGMRFSLEWSRHRGILAHGPYLQASAWLQFLEKKFPQRPAKMSRDAFVTHLRRDKKNQPDGNLNFVWIEDRGKVVSQKISESEILAEAQRQGWVSAE